MPEWYLDWSKDICIIIASGPSAKENDYERFRDGIRYIVTNDSWKLAPWADVLIGADGRWWNHHKGVKEFQGLRVTVDAAASRHHDIHLLKLTKHIYSLTMDKPGAVGMGGNSGFYALNLAIQFGCKKIALAGFDMHMNKGMHWHGPHEKGLNNPHSSRLMSWRRVLDNQAKALRQLGVEVINTSQSSALTAYQKMSLQVAIEKFNLKE